MMLDVTENKYFNVYTSIVLKHDAILIYYYSHNFNFIYDTCIRGSYNDVYQVFPKTCPSYR